MYLVDIKATMSTGDTVEDVDLGVNILYTRSTSLGNMSTEYTKKCEIPAFVKLLMFDVVGPIDHPNRPSSM